MKYFIEEQHTKNEWVYKRSHTLLLGIIFTSVLFIGVIISIVVGTSLGVTNSTFLFFVSVLIALFLDFFIAFAVIQKLGKGWDIFKKTFMIKNASSTFNGFGSQIIRFPRK